MPVIVAYLCLTSQPIVTQLSGWHQEEGTTPRPQVSPAPIPPEPSKNMVSNSEKKPEIQKPTSPLPTPASTIDSKRASNLARKQASTLALSPEMFEHIRKTVKNPGKDDILYVRLSQEEKAKLGDVSYTYKRQGIRTSDNEIVRIAINALLEDFQTNGENSILAQLLARLHS